MGCPPVVRRTAPGPRAIFATNTRSGSERHAQPPAHRTLTTGPARLRPSTAGSTAHTQGIQHQRRPGHEAGSGKHGQAHTRRLRRKRLCAHKQRGGGGGIARERVGTHVRTLVPPLSRPGDATWFDLGGKALSVSDLAALSASTWRRASASRIWVLPECSE
jgi:hypothetical protein